MAPKAASSPWGAAGLPTRASPQLHRSPFRPPTPMWGSPFPRVPISRPLSTAVGLRAIPSRPSPSMPSMTTPRPTPTVAHVVAPRKRQHFALPTRGTSRAASSSDSDKPLVSRRDFPKVRSFARGSAVGVDDAAKDLAAIRKITRSKLAKSTRGSARTRSLWWSQRAQAGSLQPYPLTANKIRLAAALLKQAGNRSAAGYLSAAKRRHIGHGVRLGSTIGFGAHRLRSSSSQGPWPREGGRSFRHVSGGRCVGRSTP